MKFKHDKTKTTKILMYAHNPGGGGRGSYIFRILGSENSGMWGFKNRKIYISVTDVLVHFRIAKLKGFKR